MTTPLSLPELAAQRCAVSETLSALDAAALDTQLASLPGWAVEGGELVKVFPFVNYHETLAFVNALAWIAHRTDHHPDLSVHYNRCRVAYSTHAIGGISSNDLICAAKIEQLFAV